MPDSSRKNYSVHGMRDLMTEILKRYHLDKRARQELAAADWPEIVGEKAAAASKPDTIRDGILFINCKSSVWAQELTLYKSRIMAELNKRAGSKLISDVRFSGGGLRKRGDETEPEEEERPSPKDVQSVRLSDEDVSRISRALEGVEDEERVRKIRGAIESQMKLEKWKQRPRR